jgi:hypothetical protein
MANKKSRPRLSEAQLYQPNQAASVVEPAQPGSGEEDLAEEYRYVLTDLKRIAILALVMLAVLIVLSFVLV